MYAGALQMPGRNDGVRRTRSRGRFIHQPRAMQVQTGRTWLERLDIPPVTAHALCMLHGTHKGGAILEQEDMMRVLLPETIQSLRGLFRDNSINSQIDLPPRGVRALRLADGFLFDLCGDGPPNESFRGQLFLVMKHSRSLKRDFSSLFTCSRCIDVPLDTPSVASVLSRIYPAWRTVSMREKANRQDSEAPHGTLKFAVGGREVETPVSTEAFLALRKQLVAGDGGVASTFEGATLRLEVSQHCLDLAVSSPYEEAPRLSFRVSPGAFGVVAEKQTTGGYVHGIRALLASLLAAAPRPPAVFRTGLMHADLANVDMAVQAVRAMGLQTTFPQSEANREVFTILNVARRGGGETPQSDVSVYALPLTARLSGICPLEHVHTLCRTAYGLSHSMVGTALLGAHAVHFNKTIVGADVGPLPVTLNLPRHASGIVRDARDAWVRRMVTAAAEVRLPTVTLEWSGEEIGVAPLPGKGVAFFAEGQLFALAGSPPFFLSHGACAHTPFCAALASGSSGEDHPVPAAEALAAVKEKGAAAAALRLSVLNMLTTCHPQFAQHHRILRAVWLHSEKQRLLESGLAGEEYCTQMCRLFQMMHLPAGMHPWSMGPYAAE